MFIRFSLHVTEINPRRSLANSLATWAHRPDWNSQTCRTDWLQSLKCLPQDGDVFYISFLVVCLFFPFVGRLCRRMGTNLGIHGLLRGFSGSVCWNSCCSRRLWIQSLDSIWSCGEDKKIERRVGERPPCNDGDHRHVLPGHPSMSHGLVSMSKSFANSVIC